MLDRLLQDTGEEEEVEFENIFLLFLVVMMTYMSTSMNFVSRFRVFMLKRFARQLMLFNQTRCVFDVNVVLNIL
jgi:hypothetical protein